MTLQNLKALLLTIGPPVHHYFASGQTDNYIIWAEDSAGSALYADDRMDKQTIQGTIDYYTKTEYDTVAKQIEDTLNGSDVSWYPGPVQHEQDTGYIHYEYIWEIDGVEGDPDA
jgi:hypothetical protein